MAYQGNDSYGKRYYELCIKSGMTDDEANLAARLQILMKEEEQAEKYRLEHNIIERTIDKIRFTIHKILE